MTINHKLGIEHRCTDGTTLLTAGLGEHAERLVARAFAALWRGTSPLPRDLDASLDPDVPFDVFRQLAAVGRAELDDAGRVVSAHGINGVRDAARHRGQGRCAPTHLVRVRCVIGIPAALRLDVLSFTACPIARRP
jgi:hypothetical protein